MISIEDFKKDIEAIKYPGDNGRLIITKPNNQESVQWCVDLITKSEPFRVVNGMIYFFPNLRELLIKNNFQKTIGRKKPLIEIFTGNSKYIDGSRKEEVFAISECFNKLFGYSTRVNLIDIGIYLEDIEGLYNLYRLDVDDTIPEFNDVFEEVKGESMGVLFDIELNQTQRRDFEESKRREYRYLNRLERESEESERREYRDIYYTYA
jgi:hypothetical protein